MQPNIPAWALDSSPVQIAADLYPVALLAELSPVALLADLYPVALLADLSPVALLADLFAREWVDVLELYLREKKNLMPSPIKSWSDNRAPIVISEQTTLESSPWVAISPDPTTEWYALSPGA